MLSPGLPEDLTSSPRRGPDLISSQLGAIAALCSDGNSIRMIACKLGIPKSTVGDAVKKGQKRNKEDKPKNVLNGDLTVGIDTIRYSIVLLETVERQG